MHTPLQTPATDAPRPHAASAPRRGGSKPPRPYASPLRQPTAIPALDQRPVADAGAIFRAIPAFPGPAASSLYIHIPFCFHKCHYCDFYSIVDTRDRQEPFLDRLIGELAAIAPWGASGPLRTIFVGGGTPSLLRPELWKRLLAALAERYDLSEIASGRGEFTVECNPETVSPGLMDILRAGGVNRVSVGAQSFEARHLKTLERWHDPENVARAVALARAAGIERQSVDLIFGIPGQTAAEWERDLRIALSIGTGHMSCYDLTYEPNTAMTARLRRGEFTPAPEDLEVEMFDTTVRTLRAAGLERYEVSNFARPGAECRHNLVYWRGGSWLAAGPSASGHVGGHRWKNTPRLDDYLSRGTGGFSPVVDHEGPDRRRDLVERIMTALRLAEGLDAAEILRDAALVEPAAAVRLRRAALKGVGEGLIGADLSRWRLTDAGFLLADGVALELMTALDPV